MIPSDIAAARLINQQIVSSSFTKAKELVAHMGAMQAQDYAMAKWAIGLRVAGSTETQIEKALDKGELIRTHVLRPTWHIIPPNDVYWMLALSADKIKALMSTMNRQLELIEKIFTKSNHIIAKCVEAGKNVTRETIAASLAKAKIDTNDNRLSHLLVRAELDEIICSGKMEGDARTYALLADRVPKKKLRSKEESLALLAKKYFTSHGPATVEDFSWWSGLTLTNARHGLEMVKPAFISEKIDGIQYWLSDDLKLTKRDKSSVHLLPAYDEFIISYKNRTAALADEHNKKVLSRNGIFNPVIVVNGQVVGLWKRSFQKNTVYIQTTLFHPHSKSVRDQIKQKAAELGSFLAKKAEVSYEHAATTT